MSLRFTKMHGLGNDFMVIDAINQQVHLDKTLIRALSKRDTGVGFDQCLLVEPGDKVNADFFYRIFNADGQEVGQCGNGARCLARFVHHYKLTSKRQITLATKTTRMTVQLNEDETVTVDFGQPNFVPALIPLSAKEEAPIYHLSLKNGQNQAIHALSVGNPHAVCLVKDLQVSDVAGLGREISEHAWFPEQTNAGFMEIRAKDCIHLRVYERGCGETRACGSGAVAAAAAGRRFHQLTDPVQVILPGGMLLVSWPDFNQSISLTGPASFVYEGSLCRT